MKRLTLVTLLVAGAFAAAACGSGSSADSPTPTVKALQTQTSDATPGDGTPRAYGRFQGTPPADFTPRAFDGTPPAFNGPPGAGFDRSGGLGIFLGGDNTALATFFGIKAEELQQAMSSGTTLAELAQQYGKTRDDLKAFLTELIRSGIQGRPNGSGDNGGMTDEQRQQFIDQMLQRLDDIIDGKMQLGGPAASQ